MLFMLMIATSVTIIFAAYIHIRPLLRFRDTHYAASAAAHADMLTPDDLLFFFLRCFREARARCHYLPRHDALTDVAAHAD